MPETAPAGPIGSAPAAAIVTVDQLIALGMLGTVSVPLRAALSAHLDGLIASLELRLGRPMTVREFTDLCVPRADGTIFLSQSPVTAVLGVSVDGVVDTAYGGVSTLDPRMFWWLPGTVVRVTYMAGLGVSYAAAVRHAVLHKALPYARALLADEATPDPAAPGPGLPIPAGVPGIKDFTVEGLHVGYSTDAEITAQVVQSARDAALAAQWTDAELAGLGKLRRPVVA